MSELNRLIQKLCPDGVQYKALQDVAEYRRGSFPQPYTNPQWYGGDNSMPFVQVADMHDEDFLLTEKTKQQISEIAQPKSIFVKTGTVLVSLQGTLGRVAITQYDCYVDRTIAIFYKIKEDILDKKFFSYVLKQKFEYEKQFARGSTLKTITKEEFSAFTIPVPPIEVQREIVRILDNFTELTAELTARKKQYEYYLNNFFGNTYDEMVSLCERKGYKLLSLSEIGTLTRGKRFVKADSEGLTDGVPCIHYGEIYTYYGISANQTKSFVSEEIAKKLRFAHKNDVVIVGAGENNIDIGIGVAWFGEDVAIHDACYILNHTLNPKYISYYLRSTVYHTQIKKYVSEGKICAISAQGVGKAMIPVPPAEEQARIVSILDRFDTLCNDLSAGLPAEIAARQKQYEYYRDKLLTFQAA